MIQEIWGSLSGAQQGLIVIFGVIFFLTIIELLEAVSQRLRK